MNRLTLKQLENRIDEFLDFKHALGSKYESGEEALRTFASFTARHIGTKSRIDLADAIHAWLQRSPARRPGSFKTELSVLRQFCLYMRRGDPSTFVPPVSLGPKGRARHVPYVFSVDEIRSLISGAGIEPPRKVGPKSDFWPDALRMLIMITYCTGLRPGEAVRLQLCDLDRVDNILHIRESKGRSRDLPFRADLARELTGYLRKRAHLLRTCGREHEPALFVNRRGHAVTVYSTSQAIRRLLRRLGMKSQHGYSGPRPYDLRHAFAVHRLTDWYHEGVDLQVHLPDLSAYMGHVDLLGTEVYLHATPELLDLASRQFSSLFTKSGHRP